MDNRAGKHILVLVESLDVNDSSGTKGRVALLKNMFIAGFEVTALHYTQRAITIPGVETVLVKEGQSRFYFLSRLQRYFYKWFGINIGDGYEKLTGFSFNWKGAENAFAKALQNYDPQDFDMIWTLGKGTNFRPHAGVLQCPEWHSKWYAYVHDPYPQQLYPRPYNFVPNGYLQKYYFFREITEKAFKVVFPSSLLKDWMQSYFPAIDKKELIIPHQISTVDTKGAKVPAYFKSSCFTILHAGNLLDLRNPEPLINAFKKFLDKHPEAKGDSQLLLIGKPGVFKKRLEQEQQDLPQLYVSEGYVPFEQVYRMQQTASVNVILEAKSEISPFLPGKFAHCVVADNPIVLIGPYYSESKRLLGKAYSYAFEYSEIEKLQGGIEELYYQWKEGDLKKFNRPDLLNYMSVSYLKEILS